jgi:ferredoxin-NADP reductase
MHPFNHDMHGHFPSGHSGPPKKLVGYEVALKDKKQIAEGTYAFVFEKPKKFQFKAGQHIRMTLINPPETDSEGNSRFFSLASTPQEKDLVIAMRMRDTAFKRVLGRMQIGDKVKIEMRFNNPHGSFVLHDDTSRPAVFLIGGIGIVPAFSMIKDAMERKLPHKIFLFYSNRRVEDAPFLDELESLAKQNPSFELISTMTEPEMSVKSWQGESGKIDQSMLRKYLDNLESPIYYVAGLPEMVSTMKTILTGSGINEDNIRAEEFTGFNLNEMHSMNMLHDTTNHRGKSHVALIAIALAILAVVILHVAAATSIFKSGLDASLLKNPIFFFLIVLMLVIIPFKLKHLLGFMHSKKKQSAQEISKVYKPTQKKK